MKVFTWSSLSTAAVIVSVFCINACGPVRNMSAEPKQWTGQYNIPHQQTNYDGAKKNVFIIADSKATVLFDMIAPFYLFNSTEQANVFIIAKDHTPILVKQGLFVNPQLTFGQVDSMNLKADVIVIPALSNRGTNQDTAVVTWIKSHFATETKIIAVCDGAATAAATGLYNGKLITCHASDFEGLRKTFPGPTWVRNVAVTKNGNLFSTAGVSNAVEGSLLVIRELFGKETMQKVMASIHYPEGEIKLDHNSVAVNGSDKWTVARKIMFRRNKKIGLILSNGVNEFDMASVLETYNRTFPSRFIAANPYTNQVQTKYGLTLLTTPASFAGLDEVHILNPTDLPDACAKTKQIRYDSYGGQYMIDACLERITNTYGPHFAGVVKKSLDYNSSNKSQNKQQSFMQTATTHISNQHGSCTNPNCTCTNCTCGSTCTCEGCN